MDSFRQIPLAAIIAYRIALEKSVKGDLESSLKYLNNAVIIAPQFTLAICEMGKCYENLGRYPEAVSKFDTVLQINPSHVEAEMKKKLTLDMMKRKG